MNLRKCQGCGLDYKPNGEEIIIGEPGGPSTEKYRTPDPELEYDPDDGRCCTCYLSFLFQIYGWFMEPVFELNGELYDAEGIIPGTRITDEEAEKLVAEMQKKSPQLDEEKLGFE